MEMLAGDVFEVVGGSTKGGIIVRSGKGKSSQETPERLSKGATIKAVEQAAGKIRYELISGEGPQSGWVTTHLQGKELLKPCSTDVVKVAPEEESDEIISAPMEPAEALKLYGAHFGENAQGLFGFNQKSFAIYGKAASKTEDGQEDQVRAELEKDLGYSKKETSKTLGSRRVNLAADCEEDSDGEEVQLCHHCSLPLGNSFYKREDEKCLHGECLAQTMVHDMQADDKKRQEGEREQKSKRHEDYGIGWDVQHIPRNDVAAKKLTMRDVPQGMVCIVHDEETKCIGVASTLEPAAALNLEYLSTALEVRRREGHEPVFSLDPVSTESNAMQEKRFIPEWLAGTTVGDVLFQADYHLKELSMGEYDQPVVGMKSCFDYSEMEETQTAWSAREWFMVRKAEVQISDSSVLRPFVKMGVEAREQVSKGNAMHDKQLTRPDHPMVMYAEAFTKNFDLIAERKSVVFHLRELAKASVIAKYLLDTHVQLEDAWFGLSEGKELTCSMEVPQLWNERYFAKVAVDEGVLNQESSSRMHGVYGGVQFGLDKFNLATSVARGPGASLSAGMPKHRLAYGLSRRAGLAPVSNIMSMASGAQFAPPSATLGAASLTGAPRLATSIGLSPLSSRLAPPSAALSATIAPRLATSISASIGAMGSIGAAPRLAASISPGASIGAAPRLATSVMPPHRLAAQITAAPRLATSIGAMAPHRLSQHGLGASINAAPRLATSIGAMAPPGRLQGVDLRLDNFDLSEAKRISPEAQAGSWSGEINALEECTAIGDTFWASLADGSKVFKDEDRSLLKDVFNPNLTDRRSDGDLFAPPDASHSYVTKLRALVKEEESVRQRRKASFFNKSFAPEEPGSVFPSSWTSSFESTAPTEKRLNSGLVARPEYKDQAAELLKDALRDSSPVFDKSTEEGLRFRIYSLGSLEVRTIQEVDGEEAVGAVFSVGSSKGSSKGSEVKDQEKVTKVTKYVERSLANINSSNPGAHRGYYIVLETESGHKIRMERLTNGTTSCDVDPEDLEDRNSLAKVLHTGESRPALLVGDMKAYQATMSKGGVAASPATCKRHAQNLFSRATGAAAPGPRPASSFRPPMMMNSFMSPHLNKKNSTPFVPKRHNPLSTGAAEATAERLVAKMRQGEKEQAKKNGERRALSEKETKFIALV